MSEIDLDVAIDALYQQPIDGFVAARNQLAKSLTDKAAAKAVKALAKPSVSAWAVNQAFWERPAAFRRLFEAGDALRLLQSGVGEGGAAELSTAMSARREVLTEITTLCEQALRDGGHATAAGTMRKIATTLEALAAYGNHQPEPSAGRLSRDVSPPGFEILAQLVAQPPRPASAPASEEDKDTPVDQAQVDRPQVDPAQLEAARAAVRDARARASETERLHKRATKNAERAARDASDAAAAVERAEAALAAARERLNASRAAATETAENETRAAKDAEACAAELAAAVAALEQLE